MPSWSLVAAQNTDTCLSFGGNLVHRHQSDPRCSMALDMALGGSPGQDLTLVYSYLPGPYCIRVSSSRTSWLHFILHLATAYSIFPCLSITHFPTVAALATGALVSFFQSPQIYVARAGAWLSFCMLPWPVGPGWTLGCISSGHFSPTLF